MRIFRVAIKNFANFHDLELTTDESIVIVGENKVGKSNFIRALQLVLDPNLSERDRHLGLEQFWDGLGDEKIGQTVEVVVEFTDFEDNPLLLATLGDSLVTIDPIVSRLTYRFQPKASLEGQAPETLANYEYIIFGGNNVDNLWMPSDRRQMPLDVQGALRDAESDLLSWRRSPLRPLIEDLARDLGDEDRADIQSMIDSNQQELAAHTDVQAVAQNISERLLEIVGAQHAVPIELGLAPVRVDALLRGLRILIDSGARGIGDASLGTANLLFLALKGLELDRLVAEGERSHTFFAVEEPEAHLHPHVQRLVYRHFLETSDEADNADTTVTTILTTHSPHIASVAPVKSIVLLRYDCEAQATIASSTASVDLSPNDQSDLQRYIDVTRGDLFFARGIIFVEGDAERFLIPELAQAMGIDLDILGITVCSVAGTNFAPYVKLVREGGLNIPFVILTDLDPWNDDGSPYAIDRVRKLLLICGYEASELNVLDDRLLVMGQEEGIFVNNSTLELELFDAGLGEAMREVFVSSISFVRRNRTMQGWIDDPSTLNPDRLLSWIELVGKGRFAQCLAENVNDDACPQYITAALNRICDAVSSD